MPIAKRKVGETVKFNIPSSSEYTYLDGTQGTITWVDPEKDIYDKDIIYTVRSKEFGGLYACSYNEEIASSESTPKYQYTIHLSELGYAEVMKIIMKYGTGTGQGESTSVSTRIALAEATVRVV